MKNYKVLIIVAAFTAVFVASATAQTRIAILPFQNMDGNIELNIHCYDLQEGLIEAFKAEDPESEHYYIIPADSIDAALAEINLDPLNPQYESDKWRVVENLKAKQVIFGNFNFDANRLLINAYIYNVKIKLAHPKYQAKNIFKAPEDVKEAIPIIVKKILPAIKK